MYKMLLGSFVDIFDNADEDTTEIGDSSTQLAEAPEEYPNSPSPMSLNQEAPSSLPSRMYQQPDTPRIVTPSRIGTLQTERGNRSDTPTQYRHSRYISPR